MTDCDATTSIPRRAGFRLAGLALLGWLLTLSACAANLGVNVTPDELLGEYGEARDTIARNLSQDPSDRQYLLDRMRLVIATMDDGYPEAAQPTVQELFDVLSKQGINADRTVASVVINERVKIWKGEPFEQAMALWLCSVQQAAQGSWDNARAMASSSLFRLKDFGTDDRGQRMNTLEIAQHSATYDAGGKVAPGTTQPAGPRDYFNSGYAVRDSNFALGYLMNGLANQQLMRDGEANDDYAVAVQIHPELKPLVDRLKTGHFNTVLVAAWGLGPRKVAYGPDGALTRFRPTFTSDHARVLAWLDRDAQSGRPAQAFPVVCDLNTMAQDHMWNNLEDVRLAKSYLGTGLLLAGALATGVGAREHSREAVYAGLGAMLAGALLKGSAQADLRYCDIMPQRVYLVPLNVPDDRALINLQIEGRPGTRLVLTGLSPPQDQKVQLRYVRLVAGVGGEAAPVWATSGKVYYSNDVSGAATDPAVGPELPFILGGRSARAPSVVALHDYNRAGYLAGMTPAQLEGLYRDEQISFDPAVSPGLLPRHVLEGGQTIVPPQAGTAGFARLFGQFHRTYQPHSDAVRTLAESIRATLVGAPVATKTN